MTTAPRYKWLEQVLGGELVSRVRRSKVLVVGAGGIGCELLKNLVLSGFLDLEVADLDTIDLSNLNRQFLFQKQHVGKPKAVVARESVLRFNPEATIVAHHGSIMSADFGQDYFRKFDVVLNALDNLAARRHVNRLCLATDVPLVESGTEGFLGQVTAIRKGESECFECQPKPSPKTFPVCTIRSTPSAPIHCVVWAKSYLFVQLFGEAEEEEGAEVDANAENAEELQALRKEANALKELRASWSEGDFGRRVFKKVFDRDIHRLLSMQDMWKNRRAPVPLAYEALAAEADAPQEAGNGLRDQQLWTLRHNLDVFLRSANGLGKRVASSQTTLSFDKDDGEILDFVTATTNLRAQIFGIEQKTRFKVKEMAGNIIPAIATTNAIIAGLIVLQAFNILANKFKDCSTTYLVHGGRRPKLLMREALAPPNPNCYVCQNKNLPVRINTQTATLRYLIEAVFMKTLSMLEPSVSESSASGNRLLFDAEFDDNMDRPLCDLRIVNGVLLNVEDDAQEFKLLVSIVHSTDFDPEAERQFELLGGVTPTAADAKQTEVAAGSAAAEASTSQKRKLDDVIDDDDLVVLDHPPPPAEAVDGKGKKKQRTQ